MIVILESPMIWNGDKFHANFGLNICISGINDYFSLLDEHLSTHKNTSEKCSYKEIPEICS